jgi:DNA-binding transcriptional ArsR family regulator
MFLDLIADPTRASAALDPLRMRLLRSLREQPDSASGLARRLGGKRQRLNYHLRELERAGFIERSEERLRGNCVERVFRVSARHYLIDPEAIGGLESDPASSQDRFSASYLVALCSRAIRDIAGLFQKAAQQKKRLATAAFQAELHFASPADFKAFEKDLTETILQLAIRHQRPASAGSRPFRLILGLYPFIASRPTRDAAAKEKE